MDGIINPEFCHPTSTVLGQDLEGGPAAEIWAPPDSWGVQPAEAESSSQPASYMEDEATDFDGYSIVGQEEHWELQKKNYCIRIFRPDNTFGTLQLPLNTTTYDLIQRLAGKFFLHDLSKYSLLVTRYHLERALLPNERPLQMQKTLLEQMGYTEQDKLYDVGREDNSYLLRFTFGPNLTQTLHEQPDVNNYQHTNFQARNLATIPIFLYKHAANIISLDLSENLLIELPIDFIQMCKRLKQLSLAGNEYTALPYSTKSMQGLQQLNISNNRLRELSHAHIEEMTHLLVLHAFNNRLTSLPDTFNSLQHLTALYISNNAMTQFPPVICQLSALEYLDISFNKITVLPDELGNLRKLIGFYAIANRLSGSLPSTFSQLENLHELDIRQNFITELDVICLLPKLEMVYVDYNAVSIVSSQFKNIKKLQMCKNHLTQFNLGFCQLPEAGTLSASLPHPVPSYTVSCLLTDLNLANCKLSSIQSDVFKSLTLLETLVLDSNTLNFLPRTIGVLTKLVRLSVQNNHLENIPMEISKLPELKVLDAQNNNIKMLPQEIWLCPSLQTLNCSSNLLRAFPDPIHVTIPGNTVLPPILPSNAAFSSHMGQGIAPPPREAYAGPGPQQLSSSSLLSGHSPPTFNPPSFFASPRNHPPPLSLSLRQLFLGDNRLTDDVWSPLSLFLELRTLNLSFNDLYEIPSEGLCHQHLYELYLSGNELASLPADDIEKLGYLRVLAVNGNKLQTLPAEIGKLRKLLVLDVGNNVLKYNIANWPYDWNWNWNLGLKYLNLSGNKRLEIKKTQPDSINPKEKNLSDFSALARLRMLGLMDITILGVSTPEETEDRRVRTSPSDVNNMGYGVADWLGPSDHLATWDLVMPRFRNNDDECIFGLFDGRKNSRMGCRLTKYLNDNLTRHFADELIKTKDDETVVSALRRTFLTLEKELGSAPDRDKEAGASAVVCYISGTKLYVANVGDALAIISRNSGQAYEITQKHIPLNPSETARIRSAGGFVSNAGLLNDRLGVSRSFGYFNLIPVVNANPYISLIELTENDEFVIMASRGLWERMSYQTAVDIARTERDDLMAAAQKLRDFALTYGADDNVMVMIIGVGDLFDKRDKRLRNLRGINVSRAGSGSDGSGMTLEEAALRPGSIVVGKTKRRGKEEEPGDSTLARLQREVPPPINQVALVFTDIKSSTLLWETQPEDMRSAIKIHDAVMRRTLRTVGGYEVKTEGDAFMVCFQNITSALLWCFTVQLQLLEADWPAGILDTEEGREIEKDSVIIYRGLSVRMGIHWGTPVFERNPITNRMDYFGPVVNKASRICNAADGGQICVSSDVIAALRNITGLIVNDNDASVAASGSYSVGRDIQQLKRLGFHVMELGERRLKGLETPEMLSLVYPKQIAGRMELDKSAIIKNAALLPETEPPRLTVTSGTPSPASEIEEPPEVGAPSPTKQVGKVQHRPSITRSPGSNGAGRILDPSLVCALNTLAIRLEHITSGKAAPKLTAQAIENGEVESCFVGAMHRHIQYDASDEELMALVENFVTRIENAASSLYLQKVGRFASVLEKLGEAIEVDSMHILRALQMYSEVSGLSTKP
ncbi:uncharacterized protein BYT42DRAFT_595079 [Radiomyces spectabilis]|uniref:uncharacterized protein n=1 Tax=Radiomyces spectabilis TaxID=64574 RepID=UPI00221EC6B8|nr:uncharacterized protein BYT42DRAFT_595079 [Radiomyces spectabilis]KAI8371608.1 hypothetical protein BYT42DRAFT_595079 [Radiomyces spectabilis]